MIINDKETLNEIMGTFVRREPTYQRPYDTGRIYVDPTPDDFDDLIIKGINVRNCNTLEGWQAAILRQLDHKHDQYVIARPGGGKTLPIICYWADYLLDLNATTRIPVMKSGSSSYQTVALSLVKLFLNIDKNTPRILIMVPVISLAQQTAAELRRDLAGIMMQYYNSNPPEVLNIISTQDTNIKNLYERRSELRRALAALTDNSRRNTLTNALKSINKTIVDEVSRFIAEAVNRKIYVKTKESNQNTVIDDAIAFVTIYESIDSIIKKIDNLRLIVIDEAHLAQHSGVDTDDSERSYQIAGSIYKLLDNRKIKNNQLCRLVMLTGTINPESAAALTNYLNNNFGRTFPDKPTVAPTSAANRSALSVIQNERIKDNQGIINSIIRSINQNDWGQLYVIFSSKTIASILTICIDKIGIRNVENVVPHGYEYDNVFSGLGKDRQKVGSVRLNDLDRLSIPPGMQQSVANITNPLLRQSVLRGIGFIHRKVPGDSFSDVKELKMHDQDKIIVAKLFKERKINVLLATDSVGIGVNIDVKDLYIPRLEKFNKQIQGHAYASLRDLSQILNRAGRGATPIASIQTPKENMEFVINALSAGPEDFPEVGAHKRGGSNSVSDVFYNKKKQLADLWRKLRP